MAGSQAASDPYVWEFEADVERIEDGGLVLSGTYFYPEGGGQPADRGQLAGREVVDVQTTEDGDVVHYLADGTDGNTDADTDEIEVGDEVVGIVDQEFRRYCMRAHTASHVLYGAGRLVLEDLGYGGFDISQEKVRVDFETSTDIDDEVLVELERLVNRAVWDSLDVSWEEMPTEEAHEREDIAFNTKTEEGVMAGSDTVRVVTVEDWDVAACGGTHVSNTSEIGPVTVLDRSNPGEGLTRVEFAVGPTAIDQQAEMHQAAHTAAGDAGVPVDELPEAIERYQRDIDTLEGELADLKAEVLDARLGDLDTIEKDGVMWQVGEIDGFEANDVGDRAKALVAGGESAGDDAPDVIAATGGEGRPYLVVAAGDSDVNAGNVVDDVTGEFGGGGGGSPSFAQGGGLDATPEEVVAYIRGEAAETPEA